ncbi:MAG: O-antigen ligase family protein [Bacteroidales bacterium]|jgi:O-antigen ligase|nr:O-antigen ligase family protein [Bacteroidales bacterium]
MYSWLKQHQNTVYCAVLIVICAICTWGNSLITISLVVFGVFWLAQIPSRQNFKLLTERRTPLIVIACCALFILRNVWQLPDSDTGVEMSRWVVVALFTLFAASLPSLSRKQFFIVLILLTLSVSFNSVFNFVWFILTKPTTSSVRGAFMFMSYNHFVLYCLMAISVCIYYVLFQSHTHVPRYLKLTFIACALWLVFYLIFLKSITGYVGLLIISIFAIIERIRQYKRYDFLIIFLALFSVIGVKIGYEANFFLNPDRIDREHLDTHTAQGNPYAPFVQKGIIENGHWNKLYISHKELHENWHVYSDIPLDSINTKGFTIYANLIRYMTSKNLRKDAQGLAQLTPQDIRNIEQGFSNYRFTSPLDFGSRIYETLGELYITQQNYNPSGKSLVQRSVYWQVGFAIFLEHPFFGSGTKRYEEEYRLRYAALNIPKQYWLRTHNQYLRIATVYGGVGFVCFIGMLILIPIYSRKKTTLLFGVNYSVFLISMISEDVLSEINGIMFFSLLCVLFLYAQPNKEEKTIN